MRITLRMTRQLQHKTQTEIASSAKTSLKSYQRIEKGVQDPKVSTAILIAKALNSTVEELFGIQDTTLPGGGARERRDMA